MNISGNIIKQAREKLGLRQRELGRLVRPNISSATISSWENAKWFPKEETAYRVGSALNVEPDALITALRQDKEERRREELEREFQSIAKQDTMLPNTLCGRIPVVGQVAAGEFTDIEFGEATDYVCLDRRYYGDASKVVGLEVTGNSLIGRGIRIGDIVIADTSAEPKDEDLAVVVHRGKAVLKIVHLKGDNLLLSSADLATPPELIYKRDIDGTKVWPIVTIIKPRK